MINANGTVSSASLPVSFAAPSIASMSPSTGPTLASSSSLVVTIVGTQLGTLPNVLFGNVNITATVVSAQTKLTFTPPNGQGIVNVQVVAGGQLSSAIQFSYASPIFSGIAPLLGGSSCGGWNLTVSGSNFGGSIAPSVTAARVSSSIISTASIAVFIYL